METIHGLFTRARTFGHQFFHRFGVHCATHQIRVILISGVVITSLLYPALAVYSSSQPRFLAHFSSQILDPFLARDTASSYYAQHDLVDVWSVHENIRMREDSVARARCGIEQTLRVERIMIRGPNTETSSALDRQTLLAALDLEKHLSADLSSRGLCLRRSNGHCLAITPLEFWRHNEDILRASDDGHNFFEVIGGAKNVTIDSVPILPDMVFTGRDGNQAQFLVLTYFFPETDCLGDADHLAWRELLLNTTEPYAYPFSEVQEPRVIELTYATDESLLTPSPLTVFIALAYLAFACWLIPNLRKTPPVHNPIGIIFTGLVEVVVSTITSLSVCALVGFKITMLPWSIFPLVIMLIGAETMSNLVVAVVKTSIALPVKERIGEGLSRAGTSNSIKVLTYNIILGIIAFFAKGAIRQFCAFSVVVLVAHWFLVHTFFVAVLSIDLQRLELEELLQQNATESLAPKTVIEPTAQRSGGIIAGLKNMLRGRAATNLSLLLLLAITATLYFATSPSMYGNDGDLPLGRDMVKQHSVLQSSRQSPAYYTWRLLNPADEPRIHIRIESPTVLVLRPPGDAGQLPRDKPTRSVIRTLTWLFRIVVLPYAVTLTALYILLLYLLKDADRLEAQRHSAESDGRPAEDVPPALEAEIAFDALPRILSSDVELLAASADGNVVVAIGLASEAVVWIKDAHAHYAIETTDILLRGASSSTTASAITALAVNDDGTELAVGTGTGVIALWTIERRISSKTVPRIAPSRASSAVKTLCFANPRLASTAAAAPPSSRPPSPQRSMILAAAYENGTVETWDTTALTSPSLIIPSHGSAVWASLIRLQEPERVLATFSHADGILEVHDILPTPDPPLALECTLAAGTPLDLPAKVHAAYVEQSGTRTLILVAATYAGVVSAWDPHTAECVALLEDALGQVSGLRVCAVTSRPCPHCRELPPDGFALIAGVGPAVLLYSARALGDGRRYCVCGTPVDAVESWGPISSKRARTSSMISNGSGNGRSRRPSMSEDSNAFPISAHGGLSRRGSEKDLARLSRQSNEGAYLPVTLDGDEDGMLRPTSGWTGSVVRSRWKDVVVMRCGEAMCERGTWDVADGRVVGVRKRARPAQPLSNGSLAPSQRSERGLSTPVLERWEVWTIELARGLVPSIACLSALRPTGEPTPAAVEEAPRLPFTRVLPLVAGNTLALAGFGNTVGVFTFGLDAGS